MTLENPFALVGTSEDAHDDSGDAEGEKENRTARSTEKQSVAREAEPAGTPIRPKPWLHNKALDAAQRTEQRKVSLFEIDDADDVFELKKSRRSMDIPSATVEDTDRKKSASEAQGGGGNIEAYGSLEGQEAEECEGGEGEIAGGDTGEP